MNMRTNTSLLVTSSILFVCAFAVILVPRPQRMKAKLSPGLLTVKTTAGMVFEPNLGQVSADAQFLARGSQYAVALQPDRMTMSLAKGKDSDPIQVNMEVVNADPKAKGEGQEPLPSRTNYFVGNDPARWRTGVPHFKRVKFADVYEGVDLVYYAATANKHSPEDRGLEYDFVVAPGMDPGVITLRFSGYDQISVDPGGDQRCISIRVNPVSISPSKQVTKWTTDFCAPDRKVSFM